MCDIFLIFLLCNVLETKSIMFLYVLTISLLSLCYFENFISNRLLIFQKFYCFLVLYVVIKTVLVVSIHLATTFNNNAAEFRPYKYPAQNILTI